VKDLCPTWKVKLFFSRHLKQFDGLTWLTLTPHILWQIYATENTNDIRIIDKTIYIFIHQENSRYSIYIIRNLNILLNCVCQSRRKKCQLKTKPFLRGCVIYSVDIRWSRRQDTQTVTLRKKTTYCSNPSRGLSAIAEFLVFLFKLVRPEPSGTHSTTFVTDDDRWWWWWWWWWWYLAPDEHAAEDDLKTVEEVVADDDDGRTASGPAFARTDRFDRRSRRRVQEPCNVTIPSVN